MPIDVKMEDHVAVVTLNEGENRFNTNFIAKVMEALDKVEKETDASTLVVTAAHDKIFSNGIDLDWVLPFMEKGDTDSFKQFVRDMMEMNKRILLFPMPTIAAISGHAFAGGAIMACYFDFRFMRSDRGFFCFPEVDINIPFLPGMLTAMKKAIPRNILEVMTLTGKRLTAQECERYGIITRACPMENLMEEAVNFAKALNKKRTTVSLIKKELNKEIIYAIEHEDEPIIETGRFFV